MTEMIKVAITGLNAGDSPAPGIPVIRCLRESENWSGRIIGLAYDALESGILDPKMVDSAYLIPYPSAGADALLNRISAIHAAEKIDVLIPNLDSELPNFITITPELERLGIRLYLPTQAQFKMRSKASLPAFCAEAGIKTPETVIVPGPMQIPLERLNFPIVVKGLFYEASVAHTREAALQQIQKLALSWGYPVLLQEYIAGDEFNVAALGDGSGEMIASAGMKKLVFTDKRKGWACVSIDNPPLLDFARTVIERLRWKGPIEIEAIQSRKDGLFYVIELNPRFPAWIYLAKASGTNLPRALLDLACGHPSATATGRSKPGVVFTNYTTNLVTDLAAISGLFTNGELHYGKTV